MRSKNAGIRPITFADVEGRLPNVTPLTTELCTPDFFLCALGFEERALRIPKAFADLAKTTNVRGRTAIHFVYTTNTSANQSNFGPLRALLACGFDEDVDMGADDPAAMRRQLTDLLESRFAASGTRLRVSLDISAASGNLIMSAISILADCASRIDLDVEVLYAEARHYYPSFQDYEDRLDEIVSAACAAGDTSSLHEYGVSDVEINELYPGIHQENRPEFIIALPAYRTERLTRCIQHLTNEPLSVVGRDLHWIFGSPPDEALSWRLDLQKRVVNRLIKDSAQDGKSPVHLLANSFAVTSTLDYRQTVSKIFDLVDAHSAKNISVIHMGSKMQGLGLALALTARSEVAVCYARPTGFNPSQYSMGIGEVSRIYLQDLRDILDALKKVGTLHMVTNVETARSGVPDF